MRIKLVENERIVLSVKILFLASLFCFIVLFRGVYIEKSTWGYDSFESTSAAGFMLPEVNFVQEMPINFYGQVGAINLHLATYGRPDYHLEEAEIDFEFSNTRTQQSIDKRVIAGSLIDNGWLEFNLDPMMRVKNGDVIEVRITAIDTDESNAPTIWLLVEAVGNRGSMKPATANGVPLPGSFSLSYDYEKYDIFAVVVSSLLFLLIISSLFLRVSSTESHFLENKIPITLRKPIIRNTIKGLFAGFFIPGISFLLLQKYVMNEYHTNPWNIIMPLILFLLIHLFCYLMFFKFSISFILTNFIFLSMHMVNSGKRTVRGDVFLAPDLFAAKEASAFFDSQMLFDIIDGRIIVFMLFLSLVAIIGSKLLNIKINLFVRFGAAALVVLTSVVLFNSIFLDHAKLKSKYNVENIKWEQTQNMNHNGFFQVFFMNSDVLFVQKPRNFSKKYASDLISQYDNSSPMLSRGKSSNESELPDNIIIVMNESFFDLSIIDESVSGYEYMPFTNEIMTEHLSGLTVVPVMGGATCNSEFEFLSGYSMAFLPAGSLPYQQYIHKNSELSIANILKDYGYITSATHPNVGNFWNRSYVYEKFGFDEFYDIHDYVKFPGELEQNRGMYTDKAVYDMILNTVTNSSQPNFIFAVTMQNHTPYNEDGMEAQYNVTGDDPVDDDIRIFLNLIRKSDEDLKYFIEKLNELDESTVVLFFGDHAPPLGAGFFDQLEESELLNKYSCPYFIYSTRNYEGLAQSGKHREFDIISSNYLGFYLLDLMGIESGAFHNLLTEAMHDDPVLSPNKPFSTADSKYLHDYEIIQYYYLFN